MEEVPPREYKRMRRIETVRCARALNFACFRNQEFLSSPRACGRRAESVTRALVEHQVDLWAFGFMPSHVHLLVFPRSDGPSMAHFLASVKKSAARKAIARAPAPALLSRMPDKQPTGNVADRFWQRGALGEWGLKHMPLPSQRHADVVST